MPEMTTNERFYNQSMKIFRGIVTNVEELFEEDGTTYIATRIFVRDVNHDDNNLAREAMPPSHMPTSAVGGGSLSVPSVNQRVIAAYHPDMSKYQILSYVTTGESSPFGGLSPERVGEGDMVTKIGGKVKSIFTMSPKGIMRLYSNAFASFEVNGGGKSISMNSKNFEQVFSGGRRYDTYLELDPLTGIQERTNHVDVWTQTAGNPGFQDTELYTAEASPVVPDPILGYTNKTVVQAGSANINPHYNEVPAAFQQYQLDTRQSTAGNYLVKDTTTVDKRGYRAANYPGSTTLYEPEGTLADFKAKRNAIGDIQTYLHRFGAFKGDFGTKTPGAATATPGTSPLEAVTGESYRLQIFNGIGDNLIPLGNPVTDPVGDNLGYDFEFPRKDDVLEQYTQSFGKLTSTLLTANADYLSNSLWRFHVHHRDITGTGLFVTEQYGGVGSAQDVRHTFKEVLVESPTGVDESDTESFITTIDGATTTLREIFNFATNTTNTFSIKSASSAMDPHIELKRESLNNQSLQSLKMNDLAAGTKLILNNTYQSAKVTELTMENGANPGGNITLNNSVDTLVMDNGVVTTTAGTGTTTTIMQDASQINLANATDSININGGTITIDAGGASSITVGPDSIVLSNPTNTLTIDASGMNLNGSTLLTNNFLTWLSSSFGAWGMGNMGAPVPVFPATAATYNSQASLPFPGGFTT